MEEEIDLRDLVLVLWKNRLLIIAIFVAAVLAAGIISFLMPPVYSVSTIIALGNFDDPVYTKPASAKEVLLSDELLLEVINQLKLDVPPEKFRAFKEKIKVEPVKDTNFLEISMETEDKQEGKAILEKMAQLFTQRSASVFQEQQKLVSNQLKTIQERLSAVDQDIAQTREILKNIENAAGLSSVEKDLRRSRTIEYLQGEEAQRLDLLDRYLSLQKELNQLKDVEVIRGVREPVHPVKPRKTLNVAVAGVLGLMVGVFAALIREYFTKNPIKKD